MESLLLTALVEVISMEGITREVKILEFFQKTSGDEEWGRGRKKEYKQRTQHEDVRVGEGELLIAWTSEVSPHRC